MKRRTASACFVSSPRSFDWQMKREVNAAPVVVSGTFFRHMSPDSSWSGLSLKPGLDSPKPKTVSTRAWDEFLSAKRTVDPSYPAPTSVTVRKVSSPPRQSSPRNLQEMIESASSCDLPVAGKKAVQRNGRVVYPNATSADNVLGHSEFAVYRGRKTASSLDLSSPPRRSKGSNSISVERNQSQISTLPGPHREVSQSACVSPTHIKPDFESHIADLPGTLKRPEELVVRKNPLGKLGRNTVTSTEQEHMFGVKPSRGGPRTMISPKGEGYKSFTKSEPTPHGKQKIQPAANRILHETVRETKYSRALKAKPDFLKNLFDNTFKLG